jgi:hypothetical protein
VTEAALNNRAVPAATRAAAWTIVTPPGEVPPDELYDDAELFADRLAQVWHDTEVDELAARRLLEPVFGSLDTVQAKPGGLEVRSRDGWSCTIDPESGVRSPGYDGATAQPPAQPASTPNTRPSDTPIMSSGRLDQLAEVSLDGQDRSAYLSAGNVQNTPDQLGSLAQHPQPLVRQKLAFNPACSPDTLSALLHDQTFEVAQTAAHNPKLPAAQAALWRMWTTPTTADPAPDRLNLQAEMTLEGQDRQDFLAAGDITTSPQALAGLAAHPQSLVRQKLASNPRCAPWTINTLTQDQVPEVAYVAQTARGFRTQSMTQWRLEYGQPDSSE